MATRMQQRRGISSQWANSNPVLNAGEIGWESDTNQFKIGDGINHWGDLSYFVDETSLGISLSDYVETSLLGVANGVATLNSSGKLESSQVPNIDELAQDAVDMALTAGTGITKTYNDNANTITVAIDSTVTINNGSQVLTNKTIDLANNTVSGTIAQFNTSLSDADFATLAGTETLTNKTLTSALAEYTILRTPEERWNIVASAATGTINIDALTAGVWYYTSNASANHTLNFRGNSGTTLNSILAIGDAVTISWLNTNGSTAYYPNVYQVDGTTSGVTVNWSGGTAPTAGNASSIDAYSFTIVKTANSTFTVLAAGAVRYA
jgi:hypothetical protein